MPITVTLKNTKKEYDLADGGQFVQFKTLITKAIVNNDTARLTEIKTQLENITNKTSQETDQLQRISGKLKLLAEVDASKIVAIEPQAYPFVAEDGETSFQELYAHLMIDMAQYTNNIDHLIWYSSLVLNMFMHAATFTPFEGHGKAQLREFNNKSQLQYYRSQGNQVSALFFNALIKTKGHDGVSRLPFNEGFIRLIGAKDFSPKLCSEIKKMDPKTGFPKPDEKVDAYAMMRVAHAGARKNNLSTLIQAMNHVIVGQKGTDVKQRLQEKIRSMLPSTKKIEKLDPMECTKRIRALLAKFNDFKKTNKSVIPVDEFLSGHLLKYRTKRVQALKQHPDLIKLKHILIDTQQHDITCVLIRLYPQCKMTDNTYKEGVTNVLLSFFGGLLNYNAEQKNLHLHTERRQSFGFYRPTLTDAGCLIIRLSLGLEPTSFDEIIVDSLKKFDDLLDIFRFDQLKADKVRKVFEYYKPIKEKEEGKRKPRAPDTHIRHVVRKDNATYTTFHQAKAYIDQAAKTNGQDFLELAMSVFLEEYVCKKNELPIKSIKKERQVNAPIVIQIIDSPVVDVLQNTLNYVFCFVKNLSFNADNEPLLQFSHVYLHSLLKLFNNCQQAQYLLSNMTRMDASEFHFQALLLTENILEYLISLDGLKHIQAELLQKPLNPIEALRKSELDYAARALQLPIEQLRLFFTDSGQQAITTTLLTLSIMLHGPAADGKKYDGDIYLIGNSYYEVAEFIHDCKKDSLSLEIHTIEHAKIIFVDVSQLDKFQLEHCTAMKALVIDTTHHPLFDQEHLRELIKKVHQQGAWVTIVESGLKHCQLGLDKYQTGKIITLAPAKLKLSKEAVDLFESVSAEAIHPSVASYLSMVNAICQEKQVVTVATPAPLAEDKRAIQALIKRGYTLGTVNAQEGLAAKDCLIKI